MFPISVLISRTRGEGSLWKPHRGWIITTAGTGKKNHYLLTVYESSLLFLFFPVWIFSLFCLYSPVCWTAGSWLDEDWRPLVSFLLCSSSLLCFTELTKITPRTVTRGLDKNPSSQPTEPLSRAEAGDGSSARPYWQSCWHLMDECC